MVLLVLRPTGPQQNRPKRYRVTDLKAVINFEHSRTVKIQEVPVTTDGYIGASLLFYPLGEGTLPWLLYFLLFLSLSALCGLESQ